MHPRYLCYLLLLAVVLSFHFWNKADSSDFDVTLDASPTLSPTTSPPTSAPTSSPIATPSIRSVFTLAPTAVKTPALDCDANSYLHVIRMYDSWGDGWGETKMTIKTIEDRTTIAESEDIGWLHTLLRTKTTILIKPLESVFEGSLVSGNEGLSYVCLEVGKCYDIKVKGSQWHDEVKWDIQAAPQPNSTESNLTGTIAKGRAPVDCQFSIPNRTTGEFKCLFSCESLTRPPSPAPSRRPAAQPSLRPSESLSLVGTVAPTKQTSDTRSFNASTNSSSVPSDLPSLSPSTVPSSPSGLDPAITAPSSGQVKLAPVVTTVSRNPSKSPSDTTFVPTSGNSFMTTMFGSSIWPTATAFPTFSFDPARPMTGLSVVLTSTSNPRTQRAPTASAPTTQAKAQNTTVMPPTRETTRSPTSEAKPSASKPQALTLRGPTSTDPIPIFSLATFSSPINNPEDRSNPTVRRPTVYVPAPTQPSVKLPPPTFLPTVVSTGGAAIFDAAQMDSSFIPTSTWFPTSSWSPTTVGTATTFPTTGSGFSLTPSTIDTKDREPFPTTPRSNGAPALVLTADVASSRNPSVSTPIAGTPRPSRVSDGDVYASAGDDANTSPILSLLLTRTRGDASSTKSFEAGSMTSEHQSKDLLQHQVKSLMYLEIADAHDANGETPSPGPRTESYAETPLPTTAESSYDDDRIPTPFFENVG